jgi:hypothetical protein
MILVENSLCAKCGFSWSVIRKGKSRPFYVAFLLFQFMVSKLPKEVEVTCSFTRVLFSLFIVYVAYATFVIHYSSFWLALSLEAWLYTCLAFWSLPSLKVLSRTLSRVVSCWKTLFSYTYFPSSRYHCCY